MTVELTMLKNSLTEPSCDTNIHVCLVEAVPVYGRPQGGRPDRHPSRPVQDSSAGTFRGHMASLRYVFSA